MSRSISPVIPKNPERTQTKVRSDKEHAPAHRLPSHKKQDAKENLDLLLDICKQNIAQCCLEEKAKEEESLLLEEELEETTDPLKKKKKTFLEALPEAPTALLSRLLAGSTKAPSSPAISSKTMLLFDKLCCEMLVMDGDNSHTTTLTLQQKEFSNSPFSGTTITIEEFSTAPKVFNVSIQTNQEAMVLIQSHLAQFMELLQDRKFSFGINRIDTALLKEEGDPESKKDHKDEREKRDS